jgi:hypothetical protein
MPSGTAFWQLGENRPEDKGSGRCDTLQRARTDRRVFTSSVRDRCGSSKLNDARFSVQGALCLGSGAQHGVVADLFGTSRNHPG